MRHTLLLLTLISAPLPAHDASDWHHHIVLSHGDLATLYYDPDGNLIYREIAAVSRTNPSKIVGHVKTTFYPDGREVTT